MYTFLLFAVPTPEKNTFQPSLGNFFAYPATLFQSYSSAILQLPTAFYYNALTGIILTGELVGQKNFPASPIWPIPDAEILRRFKHDSFRAPHGPPVYYLTSVGYGKEVGLPDGVQEVFNPCTQKTFVLDHNTFRIATENFRPQPDKEVVIEPSFLTLGDSIEKHNIPANLCYQASIIKEAFNRAKSKPVGCTLSFRGQNGSAGIDGTPGINGERGRNGGDGKNGGKGEPGKNANRGGDATLVLSGSADELVITGSRSLKIPLGSTKSEQIVLVNSHGGNGGRGGYGGKAGDGGNGSDGGNGANGRDSRDCGVNGGNGQDGGDGGSGGFGGQGGDAGDGGNAGDGGRCIIQAKDPTLLMLVEVDLMPGEPGAGVKGGKGGAAGLPGKGGSGGQGGK